MKSFLAGSRFSPALLVFALLTASALAQSPVTVTVDPKAVGATVPGDFIGLSYETSMELPGSDGRYTFSPDNKPLVDTFRTLGVKSLRVGGNMADRASKIPTNADIDSLFAFAKAAGVKVIYTVRLKQGDPQADAGIAKYVMDHYAPDLACFAIGNEPNMFLTNYIAYREEWKRFADAISSQVPDAKFCGPSATPGKRLWARDFVNDLGHDPRLILVTQHDYPGGAAGKVPNSAAGRDKLLSRDLIKGYEKFHAEFVPAVISNELPYRLEEANSFYNGGAVGVSDTFAAALWGLDYMYWWASHGAAGINFHTGLSTSPDRANSPGRYSVFWNFPEGYFVRPLGYGLKAFALGAHGRLTPITITSNAAGINLTAYAVLDSDQTLHVTLINKEHGSGAPDAAVTIVPGAAYARGRVVFLAAPSGDVGATNRLTLGGAPIKPGIWDGAWTPLAPPSTGGEFKITVGAASAAVISLEAATSPGK